MKVLIVNNTPSAFKAINQSLGDSKVKFILNEKESDAIEDIKIEKPQIVIINWNGKDTDALDTCKKIRRLKPGHYIYVLVIAAREKNAKIGRIIAAGADDFIFKPFGKGDLGLRVNVARKAIKREEALMKSKKKLMKLAKEDPITGLLNRRALLDDALNEIRRASRDSKYTSALMVSLENLNTFIETEGHLKSNALLFEFSKYLKKVCRGYDKLGRFNITRFLIILPNTRVEQAEKLGHRILEGIQNGIPVKDERIEIDSVIGISQLSPEEAASRPGVDDVLANDIHLDSLIKRVEGATDEAVDSKNAIVIYR